ncbi:LolA family protein [Membranihabitans marinus]|uniref:LolA family protein n=1 Tax=Membranihabitans marinus TaxID=1227546 RepID=UPI001F1606E8|nr:outer membrane lipoprotein carrier protein LolA [Membranihabitans marinus]
MIRSLSIILFMLIGLLAFSQDPGLKKDIDAIINQYTSKENTVMKFEITMRYSESEVQEYSGAFYQSNGEYGVYFDDYQIYSNGKAQWTIFKENKEVQITTVDPEGAELSSPAGILKYLDENSFKYFDKSALATNNASLFIIEMIPLDKNSDYFKIRISQDTRSKQIKYIEVFSRDGSRFQMNITETSFPDKIDEKMYKWNVNDFKDYYIEDLRID